MAKVVKTKPSKGAVTAEEFKNRIVGYRTVEASELVPHPRNWRKHPDEQRRALRGVLREVGIADFTITRKLEDGRLQIIDGHLRTEEIRGPVPVIVTDLSESEAETLLAALDPLAAMATMDGRALGALLDDVLVSDFALREMLAGMRSEAKGSEKAEEAELGKNAQEGGPPEMEIQPFEHHDYVLVTFKNSLDWLRAIEVLGIEKKGFTLSDGKRKVGMCRVIDGNVLLARLR